MDWRYIHKCKQSQMYKGFIHGNTTKINNKYIVGDIFLTKNRSSYKYKIPFYVPYENFQMRTNGIVTLQMGALTTRINIRHIKPYDNIDAE